jgi:hypothetical protein
MQRAGGAALRTGGGRAVRRPSPSPRRRPRPPPPQAYAGRVVPQLAGLLGQLPSVWEEPHHSVLAAQADMTQLMAALRT